MIKINEYLTKDNTKLKKVSSGKNQNAYRYEIETYPTQYENRELVVISLLEKLGYPMDRIGTRLQKFVILRIAEYLKSEVTIRNEPITEEELKIQLNDYFSHLYFDIARNELDMGTRTFHEYIQDAIKKIDYSKIDKNIIDELFANCSNEISYGEQAFILGSYIAGKLEMQKKNSLKTKKLVNTANI